MGGAMPLFGHSCRPSIKHLSWIVPEAKPACRSTRWKKIHETPTGKNTQLHQYVRRSEPIVPKFGASIACTKALVLNFGTSIWHTECFAPKFGANVGRREVCAEIQGKHWAHKGICAEFRNFCASIGRTWQNKNQFRPLALGGQR